MTRGAAYFDLDRTLCKVPAEQAFATHLLRLGVLTGWQMATVIGRHLLYDFYLVSNFSDTKRRAIRSLVRGLSVSDMAAAFEDLFRLRLLPAVRPEIVAEIHDHRRMGRRTVLLTSTLDLIARPFAREFGMDAYFAVTLEQAEGRYSGGIEGNLPHGEEKSRILLADARRHDCDPSDCFAYGDHYSDRFMLQSVGHPFAVSPDRKLRTLALHRGWPIMPACP